MEPDLIGQEKIMLGIEPLTFNETAMEPDLIGQEKHANSGGQNCEQDRTAMEPDLIGQEKLAEPQAAGEQYPTAMEPDLIGQEKGRNPIMSSNSTPPQWSLTSSVRKSHPMTRLHAAVIQTAMEPDLIGQEKAQTCWRSPSRHSHRNGA